jgi:predicted small lipoprotein YifL
MSRFLTLVALVAVFSLSGCGMKRALTPVDNKPQADEQDLMEF